MATIKSIRISGVCAKGAFAGSITFNNGLHIISAENHYGKSLVASAIAWCLNLEPLFGLKNCDNTLFQGGILQTIDLNNESDIPVHALSAELQIEGQNGNLLTLERSVVGQDSRYIKVTVTHNNNVLMHSSLLTGRGTMADESAGFQRWLFPQLGLPIQAVVTQDGLRSSLYFENIAPLLFIEQRKGWVDLQCRQVKRYRIEEVESVAVEYLLGLDAYLSSRISNQEVESDHVALRVEGVSIIKKFLDILNENAWTDPQPSERGGLEQLVNRMQGFSISAYVAKNFNYKHDVERELLFKKRKAVQVQLNEFSVEDEHRAHFADLSSKLLEVRSAKRKREEEISILRAQKLSQEEVLAVLNARLASTRDLLRLKMHSIGVVDSVECPTCHRHIDPDDLEVSEQSAAEIQIHIDALEKEIKLLKNALDKVDKEIRTQLVWIHKANEEYLAIQNSLTTIEGTVGASKEAIVRLSLNLTEIDRQIEKNNSLRSRLEALQSELDAWLKRAQLHLSKPVSVRPDGAERLDKFLALLRKLLVDVGHGALKHREASEIHVDDTYYPCINSRKLNSLGSASDTARLILSYVLALAEVGSEGGHHPGFVILDEPIQQNPDANHRKLLIDFLSAGLPVLKSQVLLFTHLHSREIAQLRAANAPLQQIREDNFLKLIPLLSANPTSESG